MASTADFSRLSSATYNDSGAPDGWIRLPISSPINDTGYQGAAFQNINNPNEIVVGHRGTDEFKNDLIGSK